MKDLFLLPTPTEMAFFTTNSRRFYSSGINRSPVIPHPLVFNRELLSSLLDPEKIRLVFNVVIKSHFNYCPLIWMFSSRRSNNLINRIHERSLRTVYNDTSSTFQELLKRNRSVSIHHKNIQILTTEVFKVVNNTCPPIMKTFFDFRENRYSIRKFQEMR